MLTKFHKFFFRPVDPASLAFWRIGFGLLLFAELIIYVQTGVVGAEYSPRHWHFTYDFFHWIKPLPENGMIYFFYLIAISALFIALGLYYRIASLIFAVGFTYLFLIDKANYLNHFYLICIFGWFFALTPTGRHFSLDTYFNRTLNQKTLPNWCLQIFILQIGIVYTYAGIAKLGSDWLFRGQPLLTWLQRDHAELLMQLSPYVTAPTLALILSWAGALLDLLIFPLLLNRYTRIPAAVVLTSFHFSNAYLFNIGVFPWMMIAATTLFFAPGWPHKVFKFWPQPTGTSSIKAPLNRRIAWRNLILIYLCIQMLLPFRHWFYPGETNWHRQATRFSWRMKITSLEGTVKVWFHDSILRKKEELPILKYLNKRQYELLPKDAELVHAFMRLLRTHLETQINSPFKLTVEVKSSYNGREPQFLIDPTIDISTEPRRWGPDPWIEPLTPSTN